MSNNMSIKQQLRKIKDDVREKAKKLTHELAKKAVEDMVDAHKSIIEDFYSYQPSSYHRKNQLKKTLVSSYMDEYTKIGHNGWIAGIKVGSSEMDEKYKIPADNVFGLMWMSGVRGLPLYGTQALSHEVNWYGNHFEEGSVWKNPYWSGENEPYKNVFRTSNKKFHTMKGKPNQVMHDVVWYWGKYSGRDYCSKIAKNIFGKDEIIQE